MATVIGKLAQGAEIPRHPFERLAREYLDFNRRHVDDKEEAGFQSVSAGTPQPSLNFWTLLAPKTSPTKTSELWPTARSWGQTRLPGS